MIRIPRGGNLEDDLRILLPQADFSKGSLHSSTFLRIWEELNGAKDQAILQLKWDGSVLFSAMPGSLVLTFAQDKNELGWLVNFNVLFKV